MPSAPFFSSSSHRPKRLAYAEGRRASPFKTWLSLAFFFACIPLCAGENLVVRVLGDASGPEARARAEEMEKEIRSLAGKRYQVDFRHSQSGGPNSASESLDAVLADSSVQAVLAVDQASIQEACRRKNLTKPVFGALIADPKLQDLPFLASPGTPNLELVAITLDTRTFLAAFQRVCPLRSLLVLVDPVLLPQAQLWTKELAQNSGLDIQVAAVNAISTSLPSEAKNQAVLLLPSSQLGTEQRRALFVTLAERRIPVLSFAGADEVNEGAMAAYLPACRQILARSVAVRFDRFARRDGTLNLPAQIPIDSVLFINEGLARSTNTPIDFRAQTSAVFLNRLTNDSGQTLGFQEAILGALERNFTLRGKKEAAVEAREDQRMATGALGPRLAATFRHQQVDRDRAEIVGVVLPETNVRAGLAFEQTLLDDEAWTRARAAKQAYAAAGFQEKSARLEVVEKAAQSYFQALAAKALVRIAEENLAATFQHMELARLRQRTGNAGPEELLRFASAEAQQRAELANARSKLEQAFVGLSRACNLDPATTWKLEELSLEHPAFAFSAGRMMPQLRSEADARRCIEWCSSYALNHSPDLATLEKLARAQALLSDQKFRRNFVPKVSIGATYERVVDMELGGPTLLEQLVRRGVLPMPGSLPDKNEWGVALTANLPLFTSGALSADQRKARSQLRQIEFSQADAREAVVARARATYHALGGSYPNIAYSSVSAESAARNLEITRQKYEQGTVSILSLLDAQTTYNSAKQASAIALYRFLGDLMAFQHAIGWYELLSTNEEKEEFFRQVNEILK